MFRRAVLTVVALLTAVASLSVVSAPAATAAPGPGQLQVTITTSDAGAFGGDLYIFKWNSATEVFDLVATPSVDPGTASPAVVTENLEPGLYYAAFYDYVGTYNFGFLNGATQQANTPSDLGVVTMTANDGLSATIALNLPADYEDLVGHVENSEGDPLEGIVVTPTDGDGNELPFASSDVEGDYQFTLPTGDYTLQFDDPSGTYASTTLTATVEDGDTTLPTATLSTISSFTIDGAVSGDGGPVLGAVVTLWEVPGPGGAWTSVDETETDQGGDYSFADVPGDRSYTVVVKATDLLDTWLGDKIDRAGADTVLVTGDTTFDDIDMLVPHTLAGTVVDQDDQPVDGATVTLSRSDTADGDYEPLPDDSPVMTTSTRANPVTTDDDGYFRWDAMAGWYQVDVTAPDCSSSGTFVQLPPERVDLALSISCLDPAPVNSVKPSIPANPRVGQLLTAKPGTWTPSGGYTYEWLRNGTPIDGATSTTYRVVPADAGKRLSVRVTAAPPGRTEGVATSAASMAKFPVTVAARLAAARIKASQRGRLTVTMTLAATAGALGRMTVLDGRRRIATVVARRGKVTVTLPRLAVGTHRLTVSYPGTAAVANATSRAAVLRVVR